MQPYRERTARNVYPVPDLAKNMRYHDELFEDAFDGKFIDNNPCNPKKRILLRQRKPSSIAIALKESLPEFYNCAKLRLVRIFQNCAFALIVSALRVSNITLLLGYNIMIIKHELARM